MNKLEFGFCEKCSYELRNGFCYRCCDDIFEEFDQITERKEARYCGETIRKIQEYIFNTATYNKELPGYNITEDYLRQTVVFLTELLNETK